MKPLKLTMSAFGSYAGKNVIDFTGQQQGIFLITGDTADSTRLQSRRKAEFVYSGGQRSKDCRGLP